jgi:hypothetical protein
MKCPNCQTEVFDIYTTEERIHKLYNANTTLGWAQNRMRILSETVEDRLKPNSPLPPINLKWFAETLREISDKMGKELV